MVAGYSPAGGTSALVGWTPESARQRTRGPYSFNAGLIASLLEDQSLPEAIAKAHLCGAAAVGVIGDIEGLPTREELIPPADDVRR
jgi:hypothetical protein